MSLRFHFARESYPLREPVPDFASSLMHRGGGHRNGFDDILFYQNLRSQPGCVSVDLVRVRVVHNDYVMGFQAVYRMRFRDVGGGRREQETEGSQHVYGNGYYAMHGGVPDSNVLELREGEYIVDVGTREGEILDAVHFVTNMRRVHFGGRGGRLHRVVDGEEEEDRYKSYVAGRVSRENGVMYHEGAHARPARRVVALAGTARGIMHRVGFYTESVGWYVAGPLLMIRWLAERGRAAPREGCELEHERAAKILVSCEEDIFRHILAFLVWNKY